jgi:ppGpp synthetase/RelA/SpoT-type nucleotidyltranferase
MAEHWERPSLSASQVRRLGSRLRNVEPVPLEDLQLLEQLRDAHIDALTEVVRALVLLGLQPTYRYKTTGTIIEKLQRNRSMSLTTMQDIAGARVVREMTRSQQDQVVQRIVRRFPDAEVIDRRVRPSFGYRAMHVVVRTQGRLVEVQIRTHLQDLRAQVVERLADIWGRQIRYGQAPNDPSKEVAAGTTRQDMVDLLILLAEGIDHVEAATVDLKAIEEKTAGRPFLPPDLQVRFDQVALAIPRGEAQIRTILTALASINLPE